MMTSAALSASNAALVIMRVTPVLQSSAFVWSVIDAIVQATTRLRLGTGVT